MGRRRARRSAERARRRCDLFPRRWALSVFARPGQRHRRQPTGPRADYAGLRRGEDAHSRDGPTGPAHLHRLDRSLGRPRHGAVGDRGRTAARRLGCLLLGRVQLGSARTAGRSGRLLLRGDRPAHRCPGRLRHAAARRRGGPASRDRRDARAPSEPGLLTDLRAAATPAAVTLADPAIRARPSAFSGVAGYLHVSTVTITTLTLTLVTSTWGRRSR